jgi:hypothetical protein
MQSAVIDRFEGDVAVLLLGKMREQLDVPRSLLPPEAREGVWLRVEIEDGIIVRAVIDDDMTAAVQARIQEKLARLRRGEHLDRDADG